jgi:hypothetical protein
MKTRIIRCHICENWHINPNHCPACGAWFIVANGKKLALSEKGLEVVRGMPMPLEKMINLDYSGKE